MKLSLRADLRAMNVLLLHSSHGKISSEYIVSSEALSYLYTGLYMLLRGYASPLYDDPPLFPPYAVKTRDKEGDAILMSPGCSPPSRLLSTLDFSIGLYRVR